MRYLLRRGLASQAAQAGLKLGELGYSTDTEELIVGTGEGKFTVVNKVYAMPSGELVADIQTDNGYLIPLCIPMKDPLVPKRG